MRAISHQASTKGEAILLMDFANAFNSADQKFNDIPLGKNVPLADKPRVVAIQHGAETSYHLR